MKLIFMGTGPFAVPLFRWILESEHELLALVTRPIADAGKRRKSAANPVLEAALEQGGIDVVDPEDVNEPGFAGQLHERAADLLVVCDYGQILARKTLGAARLGGINLHGSLLPKYRGAAPIQWAIYCGEQETGVSVIHMTPRLDGGPVLAQIKTPIDPEETAAELETRLSKLGVQASRDALNILRSWDGVAQLGIPQDPALATRAPRIRKEQGAIDWNRSAHDLVHQIRAFQPWPGSYSVLVAEESRPGRFDPLRLIFLKARSREADTGSAPGLVREVTSASLFVSTGAGELEVSEVQPAGKRPMPVAEFLRGRRILPGDRFDSTLLV